MLRLKKKIKNGTVPVDVIASELYLITPCIAHIAIAFRKKNRDYPLTACTLHSFTTPFICGILGHALNPWANNSHSQISNLSLSDRLQPATYSPAALDISYHVRQYIFIPIILFEFKYWIFFCFWIYSYILIYKEWLFLYRKILIIT
jgi:hypothetical protein